MPTSAAAVSFPPERKGGETQGRRFRPARRLEVPQAGPRPQVPAPNPDAMLL